eukprot:scaffold2462_cov402-Prasinococcus_capsulatus_cf.AAC.30
MSPCRGEQPVAGSCSCRTASRAGRPVEPLPGATTPLLLVLPSLPRRHSYVVALLKIGLGVGLCAMAFSGSASAEDPPQPPPQAGWMDCSRVDTELRLALPVLDALSKRRGVVSEARGRRPRLGSRYLELLAEGGPAHASPPQLLPRSRTCADGPRRNRRGGGVGGALLHSFWRLQSSFDTRWHLDQGRGRDDWPHRSRRGEQRDRSRPHSPDASNLSTRHPAARASALLPPRRSRAHHQASPHRTPHPPRRARERGWGWASQ